MPICTNAEPSRLPLEIQSSDIGLVDLVERRNHALTRRGTGDLFQGFDYHACGEESFKMKIVNSYLGDLLQVHCSPKILHDLQCA